MAEITDILGDLGIPYWEAGEHHHVRAGNIGIDCPRCTPRSDQVRYSMREDNPWIAACWQCGRIWLPTVIAESAGISIGEVLRILGGVKCSTTAPTIVDGKYTPPPGVGPFLKAHRRYLSSRGFDPDEVASLWGVQGIGMSRARYAWRLFIPITRRAQVVSWTARAIGDNPRRYTSASAEEESYPAKRLLYGADKAGSAVMLVEGPLDVWKIGPGAVASLGIGYSAAQKALLAKFPVRYVCFDAEENAQVRARQLCADLACLDHGKTENIVLSSGKDAGECAAWEITELRSLLR